MFGSGPTILAYILLTLNYVGGIPCLMAAIMIFKRDWNRIHIFKRHRILLITILCAVSAIQFSLVTRDKQQ